MRSRAVLLVLLMFPLTAQAKDAEKPTDWKFKSAKAKGVISKYVSDAKKLESEFAKKRKENRLNAILELEKVLKETTKAGDLDEAIKIRDAIKALQGANDPPAITPAAEKANERRFVGKWRIFDDQGKTNFILTLEDDHTAKKSHAPTTGGKWELSGQEVRIVWEDGWRDALRQEGDKARKIAFAPGKSWNDEPANTEMAERLAK